MVSEYNLPKVKEGKASKMHVGVVVDSNIEGRAPESSSVRSGVKNKKGAGTVGSSSVNHS